MCLVENGIPVERLAIPRGARHGYRLRPVRSRHDTLRGAARYHVVWSFATCRSQTASMDEARVHSAANWLVRRSSNTA